MQQEDGHWVGELEADGMLEADYIFLHVLLDTDDPKIRGRMQRALTEMLRHQNEDGGWSIYPGGPGNISLAVKCYFACKLMGMSAEEPLMVKARDWMRAHGGVVKCNTFTKIYLCALGQYDYDAVPAIPPEIVLSPNWFYFNIYEISSWSRAILVPLSIAYAKKPFKKIPAEQGIDELFVGGRDKAEPASALGPRQASVSWRNFFLLLDRMVHWVGARPYPSAADDCVAQGGEVDAGALRDVGRPGRDLSGDDERDYCAARAWLFAKMIRSLSARWMSLRSWASTSRRARRIIRSRRSGCSRAFRRCGIRRRWCMRWARPAFREHDPRMLKAADWMLSKEVRHKGDWAVKVRNVAARRLVLRVQQRVLSGYGRFGAGAAGAEQGGQSARALPVRRLASAPSSWIFAMQCKNGGWASFDKDNTKMIFQYIPFADHNAMLDPPTVDITGRILEMLATLWLHAQGQAGGEGDPVHPEGAGAGRKLVWALGRELSLRHVPGAARAGGDGHVEPRAGRFSRRRSGFAWCRTPTAAGARPAAATTIRDRAALGLSTPSQTAWAVLGLLAAGDTRSDSVAKGVRWLLERQQPMGHGTRAWVKASPRGDLSRERASRACSISHITLYRDVFPLLASDDLSAGHECAGLNIAWK